MHFKWKPWWNYNEKYRWTKEKKEKSHAGLSLPTLPHTHTFLLILYACICPDGRQGGKKKWDAPNLHSIRKAQTPSDCFNYLCIRIKINRLKKGLSPWQQTTHALYHHLSVCLLRARSMALAKQGKKNIGGVIISLILPVVSPDIRCTPTPPPQTSCISLPTPTSPSFRLVTLILYF